MLSTGIVLLVVGLVLGLGAFALGAVNMIGATRDPFDHGNSFDARFKRHIGVVIVVAVSGVAGLVGLGLIGLHVLDKAGLL